jgi:hypothetical protein
MKGVCVDQLCECVRERRRGRKAMMMMMGEISGAMPDGRTVSIKGEMQIIDNKLDQNVS